MGGCGMCMRSPTTRSYSLSHLDVGTWEVDWVHGSSCGHTSPQADCASFINPLTPCCLADPVSPCLTLCCTHPLPPPPTPKIDNCLLLDRSGDAPVKIVDWGYSTFLVHGQKLRKLCGTVTYLAPVGFSFWLHVTMGYRYCFPFGGGL